MVVPKEFIRLKQCFWQGSHEEANDEADWIGRALKLCTPSERAVVKKFVSELLATDPDVEELQRVWRSGGPSYGVHDEHIHRIFMMLRDAIK